MGKKDFIVYFRGQLIAVALKRVSAMVTSFNSLTWDDSPAIGFTGVHLWLVGVLPGKAVYLRRLEVAKKVFMIIYIIGRGYLPSQPVLIY